MLSSQTKNAPKKSTSEFPIVPGRERYSNRFTLKELNRLEFSTLNKQDKNRFLESIYYHFGQKMYARCCHLLKNEVEAQDALHDIFLKLPDKLPSFRHRASLSSWIYALVSNHCIDLQRKNKRRLQKQCNINKEALAKELEFGPVNKDILEEIRRLKENMKKLPIEDQDLLAEKYFEETSIKELARKNFLSESATKMRLLRAKKRLRLVAAATAEG